MPMQNFALNFKSRGLLGRKSLTLSKAAELSDAAGRSCHLKPYSVRTLKSTFQRWFDPVCFIQSSRFPSSVTIGLMTTGTG
jgi:hypothetical protein